MKPSSIGVGGNHERTTLLTATSVDTEAFGTPRSTVDTEPEAESSSSNQLTLNITNSSSRVSWRENGNPNFSRGMNGFSKRSTASPPYPTYSSMPQSNSLLKTLPSSASFHGEQYVSAAHSIAGDLPSADHPIGILADNPYGFDSFLSPLNRLEKFYFDTNDVFYFRHRGELSLIEKYRYDLSRAQLKASSRTSALLAGFAMVS